MELYNKAKIIYCKQIGKILPYSHFQSVMLILNFHRDIQSIYFRSIISNIFMLYCSLTCSHCSSLISFISFIDSRKQVSNKKFEKKITLKKNRKSAAILCPKGNIWFISFQMFFILCVHTHYTYWYTLMYVCMSFQKWDCTFSSVCLFHIFIYYHSTLENTKILLNIKTWPFISASFLTSSNVH